jgi:hypothetical protein
MFHDICNDDKPNVHYVTTDWFSTTDKMWEHDITAATLQFHFWWRWWITFPMLQLQTLNKV